LTQIDFSRSALESEKNHQENELRDLQRRFVNNLEKYGRWQSLSTDERQRVEKELRGLSEDQLFDVNTFPQVVSDIIARFDAEVASANRHLRTFSYLSYYVLYPLGIIIGILGQLAGVRSPGGE
jgi:hypothetical protein